MVGRVKLSVIRLDDVLSPFQEGGLVEGVLRRCAFAVTDQCLVWNLQWRGKEDFSEGFDVFQSVMSFKLVGKQGFINIAQLVSCRLQRAVRLISQDLQYWQTRQITLSFR